VAQGPMVAEQPLWCPAQPPTAPSHCHSVWGCWQLLCLGGGVSRSTHGHTGAARVGRKLTCPRRPAESRPAPLGRARSSPPGPQSCAWPMAFMQVRFLQHTAATGTFRSSQPHSAGRWHLLAVQQQARQQCSNKQGSSASNTASSIRKFCGVLSHDCGPAPHKPSRRQLSVGHHVAEGATAAVAAAGPSLHTDSTNRQVRHGEMLQQCWQAFP
jgi:hypothetical protein